MKHLCLALSVAFTGGFHICTAVSEDPINKTTTYYMNLHQQKSLLPPIIHRGTLLSTHDGYLLFNDIKKNNLTIVVAHVETPTSNTVTSLKIASGTPYSIYTCRKTISRTTKETSYYRWIIEEERGIGSYSLPEDALVFVIEPDQVYTITSSEWPKESITIPLPIVCFEETSSSKSVQASLASIDIRAFHDKEESTFKQEGKTRSIQRHII